MKIHIHSEQFDGHLHSNCGRGRLVVLEEQFEATSPNDRCKLCERYWFPNGQPDWHYQSCVETYKTQLSHGESC